MRRGRIKRRMGLDLECGGKWGRFSYSGFARYKKEWMRVLLEYMKNMEKHDKTLSGIVEVYERIVKDKEITEEIFLKIYETYIEELVKYELEEIRIIYLHSGCEGIITPNEAEKLLKLAMKIKMYESGSFLELCINSIKRKKPIIFC